MASVTLQFLVKLVKVVMKKRKIDKIIRRQVIYCFLRGRLEKKHLNKKMADSTSQVIDNVVQNQNLLIVRFDKINKRRIAFEKSKPISILKRRLAILL